MTEQNVLELFGISSQAEDVDWNSIVERQHCPFVNRPCIKTRKSQPEIAIGTCSVRYGKRDPREILICPNRLLGDSRIFLDSLHLLSLHEPGNDLHKISEVEIPGGSIDYILASVQDGRVVDFVGIELQTLDTTGTVWTERQRFLRTIGISTPDFDSSKSFGMNWKMTAKTILVQLHHKIDTFEQLGKHLVLVAQDVLLEYMRREFRFDHIRSAKLGNSLHFHSYSFAKRGFPEHSLKLSSRYSTDSHGMSVALGLQAKPDVALETILDKLQNKISTATLLQI